MADLAGLVRTTRPCWRRSTTSVAGWLPWTPRTVRERIVTIVAKKMNSRYAVHQGELEVRLGQATAELSARLSVLDNEGGAVREKVQQLEDAHTLQVGNPEIQFLANL